MSTFENPAPPDAQPEIGQEKNIENETPVEAARKVSDTSTANVIRVYAILALIWGLWYLLKHPEVKLFASTTYWWLFVGGAVLVLLLLLFLPQTRKWLGPTTPRKSAGYVIYGVIPALVVLFV